MNAQAELASHVANLSGQTINIQECGGCGGRHEGLAVQEFSTPRLPWTHWFTCPTTKDPVSVSIIQEGDAQYAVDDDVVEQLCKATSTGRMLVGIFSVSEGKVAMWRHMTEGFPYVDLQRCVSMFSEDLAKLGPPPAAEMETAPLPPSVDLFQGD